jgi:hypothetical protein
VVDGAAAAAILRLLGEWKREYVRLRLPPDPAAFAAVDEAVAALSAAAGARLAAGSRPGTRERAGNTAEPKLATWLTARDVATRSGVSKRYVCQLAAAGRIKSFMPNGHYLFPPGTDELIRSRAWASPD